MRVWMRLDTAISRAERWLLNLLLGAMIVLAFLQIVLRNFWATGFSWSDAMVRYLVLWLAFIGAALATREKKHITIDVVTRWLPAKAQAIVHFVADTFSAFICGVLAYAAVNFLRFEAALGTKTFFEIPVFCLQVVLPAAFGLMALRFSLQAIQKMMLISDTDNNSSVSN